MDRPKIENAPGHVFRRRQNEWVVYWQCRRDIAKRGFRPSSVPVWRGIEPTETDIAMIQDQCNRIQGEMLMWAHGGPLDGPVQFDGSLRRLIRSYQTNKYSNFPKLRYQSRQYYTVLMRVIEREHGSVDVQEIKGPTLHDWHEGWQSRGVTMSRSLLRMLRTLFAFGFAILENDDCDRLCRVMSKLRFPMPPKRHSFITAEQVISIRAKAHEMGYHSMALANALQFECLFRQKDVIGEWVPDSEPGLSDVNHAGKKWLHGLRWNEIDQNLILRHTTSKRQKDVEINLRLAPMVMEELTQFGEDLPASGPMIVRESTGRPWRSVDYRQKWRKIARACGISDDLLNMDNRAGGITEASNAGVPLEHIRHAAAHSDINTTQRYSRDGAEKTASVLRLRSAHRRNERKT